MRCLFLKFEFELDKMPTTQQQKALKKLKGNFNSMTVEEQITTVLKLNS